MRITRRRALPSMLVLVALAGHAARATTLTDTDLGPSVALQTPELAVAVEKSPFRITVADASAVTLVEEAPDVAQGSLAYLRGATEFRVTQATGAYSRVGDRVIFDCETTEGIGANATVAVEFRDDGAFFVDLIPSTPATVTEVAETFVAPPGERYYGLTERISTGNGTNVDGPSERVPQAIGSLDRRGELVHMSVAATIAIYTPFYHSSNGYGVFVDGPMQGSFDIAKAATDRVTIRFRFDPSAQRFRYHVLHGPDHATILDRYTTLTGRPWLPPRWAYKHMRWRDEHASGATAVLYGVPMNAALVEDVTMYETLGFPAPGWYNFDRPWTAGAQGNCSADGFSRFAFDPARFPNAPQMIAALAARGTRTIVFDAPWACGDPSDPADNAYEATLQGYYAPGSPDHIDFTNPAAKAWWQSSFGNFVSAMGISGFKLDRGDETVPSTAADIYFDGRNGLEVHNDYPRMYVKAYHDELQSRIPNDWVTMTRPGYAGSQAYGLYWGGDITGANLFGTGSGTDKGLRSAIISLQRLAFMGFPNWGTDTGGYYQFKQRDVFGRWLEFSAFTPVMEIGGGLMFGDAIDGPHAPWAMPTDPTFDTEMIDIYRYYTWLHHELVPYNYSEALRANATGHPIATPLVFDYPTDPAVGDLWEQYLYGPWFLVAPLWQDGARAQSVYLPAGAWTSYWNESEYDVGPVTLAAVGAPLTQIPLYIKLGAIIPLEVVNAVTGHGTAAASDKLTLDIFPHHASSYELREDAGSIAISSTKAGEYPDAAAITITTSAATKDYVLRVRSHYKPVNVTLNATSLVECTKPTAFDDPQGGCDWLYELGGRTLIKYSTSAAGSTVVLTPASSALCGNGTLDAGEACDDGNTTGGDGCAADCRIELGDHYKCYKSRIPAGAAGFTPVVLTLTDGFETVSHRVVDPLSACNPVDKSGRGRLVCHKLRHVSGQPDFVPTDVVVHNELGEQRLSLRQSRALCVPSEADGVIPPPALDHYKCYRARVAGKVNGQIFLVDPFEAKTTRVIKPVSFCTAVDANGSGVPTPNAALTCYRIRDVNGQAKFASRDVVLETDFGPETLTVMKSQTLCLPSIAVGP